MLSWKNRARSLADELAALNVLAPEWREPFEQIPRHVFVPRFYRADGTLVDGDNVELADEWLDAVYSDDALTTQRRTEPSGEMAIPTSSSTRPSLMAHMLRMLDVDDGHSVLEVGSGTGYNAALISHRLDDDRVTSIDIDADLVENAKAANKKLGFTPCLVVGDGAAGLPERAPYDRIIATCSVQSIPRQWVSQLAADGVMVADLRSATCSCLIALRKNSSGFAEGYFETMPGHFMWLRPDVADPLRHPQEGNYIFDRTGGRSSTLVVDPSLLSQPGLGLMIAACVPGLVQLFTHTNPRSISLRAQDGSWTRVNSETGEVTQVGERSLWDEIESAAHCWEQFNRPTPTQFRLSAYGDRDQQFWVGIDPLPITAG